MFDTILLVLSLVLTAVVLLECFHVGGFRIKNRYLKLALYLGWVICEITELVTDIIRFISNR